MKTPTTHQFSKYQELYNYFNKHLFNNKLPDCLLLLSRASAKIFGHFSKDRWQNKSGRKTGQQMNDYPTPGSVFLKTFKKMPKSLLLPFKSSEVINAAPQNPAITGILEPGAATSPSKKNKTKYSCLCGFNIWGKPDLNIL